MNLVPFLLIAFCTAFVALVGGGWLLGLTIGLGIVLLATVVGA